jgi:hypothetical protein
MKWLLSEPWQSIRAPIAEFDSLISLENIQPFLFSSKFSPVLPARLESLLYPRQQPWLLFLAACGIIFVSLLTRAWIQNRAWWVAIPLTLLVFPHYFIVWHGDVMGIFRHALTVSVQFYLGIWLLALLVVDGILSSRNVQASLLNRFSMSGEKH